jgi:hypothetical protein
VYFVGSSRFVDLTNAVHSVAKTDTFQDPRGVIARCFVTLTIIYKRAGRAVRRSKLVCLFNDAVTESRVAYLYYWQGSERKGMWRRSTYYFRTVKK